MNSATSDEHGDDELDPIEDDDDDDATSEVDQVEEEPVQEESDQQETSPVNGDEDDEQEHQTRDVIDPGNPLDEDSMEAAQNLTQEDVFGEELSDLSGDEDGIRRKKSQQQRTTDMNGNQEKIGDEDEELLEEHEEEEEEQVIVDTPRVTCDLGREIHLVKLPTFMQFEPKPFDSQYFNEELRDDDDEESKARMKLKLENTMRWRLSTNEHGEITRESNTRLVRWSDGSLSLHLGKEIFDVSKANIQGDHNHLFVRHQKSMQAQAVFRTKVSFRQHSHDSLAHLKLKFASKANPAPKVRVLSNIKAPLTNNIQIIRKEEQRIKAEERRRNQQLRQRERAAYRNRNLIPADLEGQSGDDDDDESINTNKKKTKEKKGHGQYLGDELSETEDDPNEKFIGQRAASMKHRKIVPSDDEDSNDEQDKQPKRKRVHTLDDDDDEEDEEEEEEEEEHNESDE